MITIRYDDIDQDTLQAEKIAEDLLSEHHPRILDKVVQALEKALRRLSIAKMLEKD